MAEEIDLWHWQRRCGLEGEVGESNLGNLVMHVGMRVCSVMR